MSICWEMSRHNPCMSGSRDSTTLTLQPATYKPLGNESLCFYRNSCPPKGATIIKFEYILLFINHLKTYPCVYLILLRACLPASYRYIPTAASALHQRPLPGVTNRLKSKLCKVYMIVQQM